jgi:hypothetical protein
MNNYNLTMDRERLKLLIANAFSAVPHPGAAEIGDSQHCDECRGVVDAFQHTTWQTIPAPQVDANYDKLPLLSPAAYHHFLPAFLIRSIEAPGESTWEFTFYALTPKNFSADPKRVMLDRWHDDRTRIFTAAQISSIIAYLEFQHTEFERLDRWLATEKVMERKLGYWRRLLSAK